MVLLLLLVVMGCAPKTELTVLIKMMPNQERHFRNNVIPPFEKKNKCNISVINYDDMWNLSNTMKKYDNLCLVKTPFDVTHELVENGDIMALEDFLTKSDIDEVKKEYFLTQLGSSSGKIYYTPRKFESRMLVYLKSKVIDAVNNWVDYKDELNAVLKRSNGYGLPFRYELEADPNKWDYYDIFVVGYYWANTKYNGKKVPRIAHRAKRYPGTALRIVDRCYQLNAEPEDILLMDTAPIIDAFEWEAVYINEKLFVPAMWLEGWSGSSIWQGFKNGNVFLSFMTQIDCFFLHGTGTKDMPGYLQDPDDLGVAVMPKGVSFGLDDQGNYLREGKRSITTGGWWWGIPKKTPNPKISYDLARWITNTDNQIEGCSNYGMIPVRKDILGDISLMFGGGWITNIFNTAFSQLVENRYTTIPLTSKYGEVGKNYIEAWYDICVKKNCVKDGKVNRRKIFEILEEKYIPIQKDKLGDEYPQ